MTLNTGANNAVVLATNTGATIALNGSSLDITTTTGQGFVAFGGGTISVPGQQHHYHRRHGRRGTGLSGVAIDAAMG